MSVKQPEPPGRDEALNSRLEREATFHDAKYSGADLYPRHYAVRPTEYVYTEMSRMLGDLTNKKVLEYGCGEGWITKDLASRSAEVFAFDVSDKSIATTRSVLNNAGLLSRCHLQVMPAESLTYSDESMDIAIGFAIIHHLDLTKALAELHRVLRPGGLAYFAEPLGTNPAIEVYRRFTPQYRTRDERPLVLSELPYLLRNFRSFQHQEFYLTALAAVALAYAPGGQKLFSAVSPKLHRLDRALLRQMPKLGRFAWYTVIRIEK